MKKCAVSGGFITILLIHYRYCTNLLVTQWTNCPLSSALSYTVYIYIHCELFIMAMFASVLYQTESWNPYLTIHCTGILMHIHLQVSNMLLPSAKKIWTSPGCFYHSYIKNVCHVISSCALGVSGFTFGVAILPASQGCLFRSSTIICLFQSVKASPSSGPWNKLFTSLMILTRHRNYCTLCITTLQQLRLAFSFTFIHIPFILNSYT